MDKGSLKQVCRVSSGHIYLIFSKSHWQDKSNPLHILSKCRPALRLIYMIVKCTWSRYFPARKIYDIPMMLCVQMSTKWRLAAVARKTCSNRPTFWDVLSKLTAPLQRLKSCLKVLFTQNGASVPRILDLNRALFWGKFSLFMNA